MLSIHATSDMEHPGGKISIGGSLDNTNLCTLYFSMPDPIETIKGYARQFQYAFPNKILLYAYESDGIRYGYMSPSFQSGIYIIFGIQDRYELKQEIYSPTALNLFESLQQDRKRMKGYYPMNRYSTYLSDIHIIT